LISAWPAVQALETGCGPAQALGAAASTNAAAIKARRPNKE
jgi:hypothetical protein